MRTLGFSVVMIFLGAVSPSVAQEVTWTDKSPIVSPPPRFSPTLAYDAARNQVVLFGGTFGSNRVEPTDTWVWDGSSWVQKLPSTTPPGRSFQAMAYDAARREVVLFGGAILDQTGLETVLNDTWVWNGSNWSQRFPVTTPTARKNHSMVFDSTRNEIILFGGTTCCDIVNDTWVWDGSNWTQKNASASPVIRIGAAMAYDELHGQAVLFGGLTPLTASPLDDTWVWDGSTWTEKLPATSPQARSFVYAPQSMAYDALQGQVLLFSGFAVGLNDTWLWDGSTWTQQFPTSSPPLMATHAITYDAARQQIVLFGQPTQGGQAETWLWGPVGTQTLADKAVQLSTSAQGSPYLWGGKGWDYSLKRYVTPNIVRNGSYKYWRPAIDAFGNPDPLGNQFDDHGIGLDCSGLILWSYNKALGVDMYVPNTAPCATPICYENANGQFLHNSESVSEPLRPGDLLFFNFSKHGYDSQCLIGDAGVCPNGNHCDSRTPCTDPKTCTPLLCATHVAMYVGDNQIVQARAPGELIAVVNTFETLKTQVIPQGLRRVSNPQVGLIVKTGSAVSLSVRDPDGFTISADTRVQTDEEYLREVPGQLYYTEGDQDADGTPNAAVYAPTLKVGDYVITPLPLPSASANDTYSLEVTTVGSSITLAHNVPIDGIPLNGYGIRSTGSQVSVFVPVAIDVKPGSGDNSINPKSKGKVPVAVLSSPTFNAPQEVNVASLSFGPTGTEQSLVGCAASPEDVNGDGLKDLLCRFDSQRSGFRRGNTQGILNGDTNDNIPITGRDVVKIVP